MNIIKKLAGLASTAILALGILAVNQNAVHAYSDYISSNNATAMIVRITPNADRGVQISTGNVHLDLGAVDLGASTQTVRPATVTITGNMIECELDLAAAISGGWVFENFQQLDSTGANQLNAWVQFTSVSTGLAPAQDYEYFRVGTTSGSKITSLTQSFAATAVGIAAGSGVGRFENNEGNASPNPADMDSMTPAAYRHMFTYFRLPPTTSVTGAQDINFTLSVRAGP